MIEWRLFIPSRAFLTDHPTGYHDVRDTAQVLRVCPARHDLGECFCSPVATLTHHVKHMANQTQSFKPSARPRPGHRIQPSYPRPSKQRSCVLPPGFYQQVAPSLPCPVSRHRNIAGLSHLKVDAGAARPLVARLGVVLSLSLALQDLG